MRTAVLILAMLLPAIAQAASLPPYPPDSNGCSAGISKFYRTVLRKVPRWEHCCYDHDHAYRRGGTWTDRMKADGALLQCVARDNPGIATAMWIGVRAAGTSVYQFDWRKIDQDYAAQYQYRRAGAE